MKEEEQYNSSYFLYSVWVKILLRRWVQTVRAMLAKTSNDQSKCHYSINKICQ